jgi:DNA helicase II / ATP-dependent DNA helicase PcrA
MKYYADLHIHSSYSRATAKDSNLEHLWLWAQRKGITVVGTGDCIHPVWLDELQAKLKPAEDGLFALDSRHEKLTGSLVPAACRAPVRFMLSTEISNIYRKDGAVRKVHNLVCLPSFDAASRLQSRLSKIGNIHSDGRPILGLDSRDLLEIVLDIDERSLLIPAHIWTPWFSVLGSKSGFDRIGECYGDLTKYIYAVETGLSSDPLMNWRLRGLDDYMLVSNSDAHSPSKLGRESTIFNGQPGYGAILGALRDRDDTGLAGTIEFFPEEGKYHLDGHRACKSRLEPSETVRTRGLCPVCGKGVTVGVLSRVEELADRPRGEKPPRWRPYHRCIPLPEILAEVEQCGASTKRVGKVYLNLLEKLGNEYGILLEVPLHEIAAVAGPLCAEGIGRMRRGALRIAPGFDGEFGVVTIFSPGERTGLLTRHET